MVQLGDKARCLITGFEGICTARTDYLTGCTRISLMPPMGKDGKLNESQYFDEPMCVVVKAGVVKIPGDQMTPAAKRNGGPRDVPPAREVPR